jgi:hypothetical protein
VSEAQGVAQEGESTPLGSCSSSVRDGKPVGQLSERPPIAKMSDHGRVFSHLNQTQSSGTNQDFECERAGRYLSMPDVICQWLAVLGTSDRRSQPRGVDIFPPHMNL